MIPALIVPVLNRIDLLGTMLQSIDWGVDELVIVDNGGIVPINVGDFLPLVERTHVIQPGHNLGVAASWNLGMKVTPKAPWWCIVGSDVVLGAGDLLRLDMAIDPIPTIYYMIGHSAFALTRQTVDVLGYYDENFHPAYDEDLDYDRRADLVSVPRVNVGFTGTHVGSATIRSDASLHRQNGPTHSANDAYYARKWGGPKQGGETFSTPFNRGGHIGDWRLESGRLVTQSWKKE